MEFGYRSLGPFGLRNLRKVSQKFANFFFSCFANSSKLKCVDLTTLVLKYGWMGPYAIFFFFLYLQQRVYLIMILFVVYN